MFITALAMDLCKQQHYKVLPCEYVKMICKPNLTAIHISMKQSYAVIHINLKKRLKFKSKCIFSTETYYFNHIIIKKIAILVGTSKEQTCSCSAFKRTENVNRPNTNSYQKLL